MTAKTVLITGAGRGIGLTFTKHYMSNGWKVIAAARNVDGADALRELGPHKIVQLDVTDEASIERAAKELDGEAIDLLVNNAGVLWRETLENAKKADVMKQFEVNAVGSFLVTRAFRDHLKRASSNSGLAKVMNISSVLGSIESNDTGGYYGYRASKAALNALNMSLALDLKADNIASLVLHPGYVATDMNNFQGTVTQEDSVIGLASFIDTATIAETGKYFDYTGAPLPW